MTNDTEKSYPHRDWLKKMADAEDQCNCVSVGGLASDLGMLRPTEPNKPRVLGHLIELTRRSRRMSIEKLADKADVDLGELLAIEQNDDSIPTQRTVFQIAKELKYSTSKLMILAGLVDDHDSSLSKAALQFAARSETTAALSENEKEALEEFVEVLADATARG